MDCHEWPRGGSFSKWPRGQVNWFCFRSENLTVEEDGVTANITTFTRETKKHKNPEILSWHFYIPAWLTKSISFKFDEPFLVQHGNPESKERIDEVCREMPRKYLTFFNPDSVNLYFSLIKYSQLHYIITKSITH